MLKTQQHKITSGDASYLVETLHTVDLRTMYDYRYSYRLSMIKWRAKAVFKTKFSSVVRRGESCGGNREVGSRLCLWGRHKLLRPSLQQHFSYIFFTPQPTSSKFLTTISNLPSYIMALPPTSILLLLDQESSFAIECLFVD